MPFPPSTQPILVPLSEIAAFFRGYADTLVGQLQPFREVANPFLRWTYVVPAAPTRLTLPFSSVVPEFHVDSGIAGRLHQLPIVREVSFDNGPAYTMDMGEFTQRLQHNASFGATILQPDVQAKSINNFSAYRSSAKFNVGFTTNAWDGKKFWVLDTAPAADKHPCNIGKATLGSYHTARENFAITAINIRLLLQDVISRPGYDGKPLGTQRRPFVWGPTERRLEFEDLLQRVEWTLVGGAGGNNTAMQRAEFVEIPGLRADMWGAAVVPETVWELAFVQMLGALPNKDVASLPLIRGFQLDLRGTDTTPHREVVLVDQARAESQLGSWIGVQVKIKETFHLLSPAAFMAAFTGPAS
jgi:hypothetical protein